MEPDIEKTQAERLAELAKQNGGRLTPELVVADAENEDSPLHSAFTWDDSEAAAKWRIEEARTLIRSVRLEMTVEERQIRCVAYVHDPARETGEAGYVSVLKVRKPGAVEVVRAELNAAAALLGRCAEIAAARAADVPGIAERVRAIEAEVVRMADGL